MKKRFVIWLCFISLLLFPACNLASSVEPTTRPTRIPTIRPTPVLPDNFVYYDEPVIGIQIAVPNHWERASEVTPLITSTESEFSTSFETTDEDSNFFLVSARNLPNLDNYPTGESMVASIFGSDKYADRFAERGYKVISTNTNFIIDGRTSYYHAYRIKDINTDKGYSFDIYSVVVVTLLKGNHWLWIQFTCNEQAQDKLNSLITPILSSIIISTNSTAQLPGAPVPTSKPRPVITPTKVPLYYAGLKCIKWSTITIDMSAIPDDVCVYGIIGDATISGNNTTVVTYDAKYGQFHRGFHLRNVDGLDYDEIIGKCVVVAGKIKVVDDTLPYMEIDKNFNAYTDTFCK